MAFSFEFVGRCRDDERLRSKSTARATKFFGGYRRAMKIDGNAAERLANDTIGWLVTVNASGQPQSSPVWFIFDDGVIYLQSQTDAAKLRNIAANDRVSFHLGDDGQGRDIVIVEARAEALPETKTALLDKYAAKYGELMRDQSQGATANDLATFYPVTVWLSPTNLRAW
jgi:PPOX class probable F420-dependent enzyme